MKTFLSFLLLLSILGAGDLQAIPLYEEQVEIIGEYVLLVQQTKTVKQRFEKKLFTTTKQTGFTQQSSLHTKQRPVLNQPIHLLNCVFRN